MEYDFQPGVSLDVYLCPGVGMVAEDYYSTASSGAVYRAESLSLTGYTVK